jgi:signal transduction histidine kinase
VHHQVPTEVFWRQDGTYFPTEYTSTPILDEGRQIKGAVVTFRDISERHRNENLLRGQQQILEMISVEKSLVEIFERICGFVEELDPGSICSIFLYDGMTLRVGAAPSLPASYTQALEGMLSSPEGGSCGTAAYRKEQVIVSDIATDPLWKRFGKLASEHGLRACWSTPILSKSDTVLGVLGIYHRQPQNPEATDFALMDLSCGLAGVAIERHLAQDILMANKEELQALGGRLITAQEDERRRISRELHDDMNQRLAVLALTMQSAQKGLAKSTPTYQTFQKLYDEVSSLSDDVRHLAYQLHPSLLDDLGLKVALQSYLDDFSKWEGIPVAFVSINIPGSLPQEVASCLYRITQECMRNVARHAQATQGDVKLLGKDDGLTLSITDNGKGFKVDKMQKGKRGLGLIGMQERVRAVQGTYELKSAPGQGTQITVWVPTTEVKSEKLKVKRET